MPGRVYWITGLSGSGKTTIGTLLYYELRKQRNNVVILDGDILKLFMGDKVEYQVQDRLSRGKRYSQLCKTLADQGLWVIICTIAMFDEIRQWNREHIREYIEIFLDVPMDVLKFRDKKGIYSDALQSSVFSSFQFPKTPDLVLKNEDGMRIKDAVDSIINMQPRAFDDYNRDSKYWDRYYESHIVNEDGCPSDFARLISAFLQPKHQLLDIGCGNGRDSLFFLSKDIYVTGVDASESAIIYLNELTRNNPMAMFVCDDFVKCRTLYQRQYDYIYSRFTLHAINSYQQSELLKNIHEALKPKGKVFIEARSIHDDLYGKGEKVEKDAFFYDGHFRRFISAKSLEKEMIRLGYNVLSIEEGRGFSRQDGSDPILVRLIASV